MPRAAQCSAGWRCCCGAPSGRSPTAGRVTRSPGCSMTPCCRRSPSSNGASQRPTRSWRVPPGRPTRTCGRSCSAERGSAGDDLRGRVHAAVEHARQRSSAPAATAPRISVNVIDDGCRLAGHQQDLLARAIGEAVANAIEHAHAATLVVFAETDDDGQVFASVRDDGTGFDPARRHGPRSHRVDRRATGVDRRPGRGAQHAGWRDGGAACGRRIAAGR